MCPSSSGDRASASGAESRRFESYLGHHSDFPRTRMMRVFLFSARNSNCLPPIAEHAAALSRKKASPRADSLGRACIPSAQCIVANHTQLTRAAVSAAFVFSTNLRQLSPPCARAHQSGSPQATSSDRLISRNGLQQAAWRCSQPHRRRTTRRAPRYRCSRD